ncbi:MAG: N-6 DNA methylase [Pirellulales bacterium]|nr:N-6 DNA methylase [Pirellulales bacterium]
MACTVEEPSLSSDALFALVVKLTVAHLWANVHARPSPLARLARVADDNRRDVLAEIESSRPIAALRPRGNAADPWGGYLDRWSPALDGWIARLAGDLLERLPRGSRPPLGQDFFGAVYQETYSRAVRHALGEYYTPAWLAAEVFDQLGYSGRGGGRLLDPCCGSGVFLLEAIRRLRAEASAGRDPAALGRAVLARVAGFDVHPLAVLAARANCLLAVADLLPDDEPIDLPIHRRDVLLDPPRDGESFAWMVGNPPWIAWDHLPANRREATKPLWRELGLFSLSPSEARHGGGKKDLAMLVLYAAADRYLLDGGRLGFVITQTLFQSKGAGDGFRRFRLGENGTPLRVLSVHDLVAMRPFPGAANWTATIALEKGQPTQYPVPYTRWEPMSPTGVEPDADRPAAARRRLLARPINPDHDRSPWLVLPEELDDALRRRTGPSDYAAHLGANSGGANGVYWLDVLGWEGSGVVARNLAGRGKRAVRQVTATVEPDLLFPLARWADVARYRAVPSAHVLLVQDLRTRRGLSEEVLRRDCPRTLAYLESFRETLSARAAYRRYQQDGAFYSMYNVGPYTVAPWKVVWRRMDRRITAARLGPVDDPLLGARPAVIQETCVAVEVDSPEEGDYLAAMLNSAVVNFVAAAHSVRGGKGFGTPSMLDYLALCRYNPANARHRALAAAGGKARTMAAVGDDPRDAQQAIDELAGALWGLNSAQRDLVAGGA